MPTLRKRASNIDVLFCYFKKGSEESGKNRIRIGRISSINREAGMARIVYSDKNSTSSEIPLFNFNNEYNPPKIGELVLVIHLSNDSSTAIIMGGFWNAEHRPAPAEYQKDFQRGETYEKYQEKQYLLHTENIVFECAEEKISVKKLIEMKKKLESLENNV